MHAGTISQVTRDHSMVQEMVDRKLIRAEDAAQHPDANKILRALGIAKDVDVDLRAEPLVYVTGDVLVLCSDGLSDLVEPAEILEIAGSHSPAQAAGRFVDLANARGGHDNITAMVLRMKASATPGDAPTLLKTVAFTAHAPLAEPTEKSAGPTGTLVSPPMAPPPGVAPTMLEALPAPPAGAVPRPPPSGQSVAIPSAQPHGRARTPMLVLGLVLAVIAVGILAAVVVLANRPGRHRAVPLIEEEPREAAAPLEDDGGPDPVEPTVAPAPPLEPTSKPGHRDGGTSDPCGALRRLRDADASARVLTHLEERCRASGGTP